MLKSNAAETTEIFRMYYQDDFQYEYSTSKTFRCKLYALIIYFQITETSIDCYKCTV